MSARSIGLLVVLAAALLAIGIGLLQRRPVQHEDLGQAFGEWTSRPAEVRFSTFPEHRPYDEARRLPPPRLRIRELIERADRAGASLAAIISASTVESIWGDKTAGAARLLQAIERDSSKYEPWLDLSAVFYLRAQTEPDAAGQLLAASIDAALHATRLTPSDPRAWFNAALALHRFGATDAAAEALLQVIEHEDDVNWKSEAIRRLDLLQRQNHRSRWPSDRAALADSRTALTDARIAELLTDRHQPVRELIEDDLFPAWATLYLEGAAGAGQMRERLSALARALKQSTNDGLLALAVEEIRSVKNVSALVSAYRAHGAARKLYEGTDREAALGAIDASIRHFESVDSVFTDRARMTRAMTLYQLGRYEEAERLAVAIERRSANHRSPSVQGAAAWLLGIALTQRGAVDDALAAYDRAAALFKELGELEDLAAVENSSANLLRIAGDVSNGWRHLLNASRGMAHVYTARRRHTIMLNASLFAAQHDRLLAALEFEEWSLRAAQERGVANTIVDALMRRARLRLRIGDISGASADLSLAAQHAETIGSQSARTYLDSWLALVSGESRLRTSPVDALDAFARAKKLFEAAEPAELPNVYLAASRAHSELGNLSDAGEQLRQGIEIVKARRDQIRTATLQASYQDVSWELFDRLIDLDVDRGDLDDAFRLSETSRNLLLSGQTIDAAATPVDVARTLPPDVTLVYYVATTERLLIWSIRRDGVTFATEPIGRVELDALVNRYRSALVADAPELDSLASRLGMLLTSGPLQRAAENSPVVIIPDGALHRLPFASLRGKGGRYLIEDHPIATVPSASALRRAQDHPALAGARDAIVLVGSAVVPTMPPLPEVAGEIRAIASLYSDARALTGDQATFSNTVRALKGASILHFAGHAKANADVPWQSKLFFVPDHTVPNGVVTSEMLRRVDLSRVQLVVFSACETGDGPILRGTGVSSLASTLLFRGVPSVVAALWAVEDRSVKELLTSFHAAYVAGASPAAALRTAQLTMLRSRDPRFSRPPQWSAITIASAR